MKNMNESPSPEIEFFRQGMFVFMTACAMFYAFLCVIGLNYNGLCDYITGKERIAAEKRIKQLQDSIKLKDMLIRSLDDEVRKITRYPDPAAFFKGYPRNASEYRTRTKYKLGLKKVNKVKKIIYSDGIGEKSK